ncbi:hypothetical protein V1L54_23040 [Streptomyces sp. TRM 70361]|uniref:hypothetical protein n=1 Tax=Streptomyces sp. TRM 70361 TaxID=3116553 RepID=UPI002E7B315B|nr:hypothetical protein [Streptomyces sp. TRM 70361]MEE1942241.1 hypothetical protein [Streptomyces sp. TRM 70361]
MTAPTPPPSHHGPSRDYDPWTSPPPGAAASGGPGDTGGPGPGGETGGLRRSGAETGGVEVRREVRDAVPVAVAVAVAGVALGLLWLWLAPRIPLVSDGTAVYLRDSEGEETVGADGTFVLLALGVGALTGAAVFLARRRGGIGTVIGLALGAVLGSVLAWRLGVQLGPEQDVVARAGEVGRGEVFDAPLELKAKGALLAWPFAALLVHLGLTALFGPRDPGPEPFPHPGWGPPPGSGAPGKE